MREILFKAKRKDNGEWIEGGYAEHGGKVFIVTWVRYIPDIRDWDTAEYYESHSHYNSALIEVIPETVCQYTGLTDKGGKKIWEGDIVQEYPFRAVVRFGEFESLVLKNIGFNLEWINRIYYRQDLIYWTDKIEVIGNIFDNPELLSPN